MTDWMRPPEEFDYVVEPDVFHDLFGHVPLRFDPMFANHMQAHGAGGLKASRLDGCELPARLCYRIDSYEAGYFVIDSSEQLSWIRQLPAGDRPASQYW